MSRIPFACALAAWAIGLALGGAPVHAQKLPAVQQRWYHIRGDSVLVEYALPETAEARPAVIVLPDRFGLQPPVSNIVAVFAMQGFRAYAIPLRSAPKQDVAGHPGTRIDSSDVDRVAQITVEIRNAPGCNGKAGLVAFDAGAVVGAIAARRMPLFTSCVLFYPSDPDILTDVLPFIAVPLTVTVGDGASSELLEAVTDLKELAPERKNKIRVRVIKDSGPFFFNQKHASYRKESMNTAWIDAIQFLRGTL
ncbi:MAG: dienelactone hydrolase family protein [Ignavibacteria bacterium]|nr:dienelactone hydrolase family protein [Ignavibacteria bacterium]